MYRIILVDDEPLILAGIASLISWEDHDCTIVGKATNGPSAYEMIMSQKPDIVITDIRMPVMDGLALMEKCQAAGFRCPFIVLTNLEEFSLARKALSLGACEYLVKLNLTPEELFRQVQPFSGENPRHPPGKNGYFQFYWPWRCGQRPAPHRGLAPRR